MNKTPIEEGFEALRDGREAGLQTILPRLRERLLHLAKQRLRGDQAEEVVQETLATLWEKRDSIEGPGHLLPFLFQALRHKIGNAYARARKERDRDSGEGAIESLRANPSTVDPGALAEGGELREILEKAIRKCLSENERQGKALSLLYGGKSAAEIGSEMGDIPVSTVRTLIHRGRKRLKEILKSDFALDL